MKRFNLKGIFLSVLLVLLIVFLISFNVNYFINAAPAKYQQNIDRMKTQLSQRFTKEISFANDFSFTDHVYIFFASDQFYVLDDQYVLVHQEPVEANLDLNQKFGYYNEQLVIVEKDAAGERFLDLQTKVILFEFKGGRP